jgi:chitin disaccharide deacetylase
MVGGAAAADAVSRARRLPKLRIGLHLVLVDGDPVSNGAEIPDLLDGNGRLRGDLGLFGARITLGRSLRRQVAKETAAQFEAFRLTGLPLDHVNGHRHFHLHPVVAAAVIDIGRHYGMRALRIPTEPRRVLCEIDPQTRRRGASLVMAPWAALLRRTARRDGLTVADAVFGLEWSGAMTAERLAALIKRVSNGLVEIYLHPATSGGFAGAAPGYRYAEEFAALGDAECLAALRQSGCTRGGYTDLHDS